jgi:peptidoglycan/xylan/chitin deacetylase (PgdA/CDA1 family)
MRASRLTRVAIVAALTAGVTIVGLRTMFAEAATTNLISNPSAESAGANAGAPADWTFSAWGTNTVTQSWKTGGQDGQRSLAITMSAYTSGDAKWMSAPIPVKANTTYALSDWYISTVRTSLEAVYTNAAGKETYVWLADVPASSAWKQASASFKTPADAVRVAVYHLLEAKGSLQTDTYTLTDTTVSTPPTNPPPPVTPPTIAISAPADGATVNGTVQFTATASNDTTGVTFKVDDVALGAEDTTAPFAAVWDTKTVTNKAYKLTATARNAAGGQATTDVTVTVNNAPVGNPPPPPPPPQPGNLIANPGLETVSGTAPASWSSSKWGTNTTKFTYPSTAHSGTNGARTDVTAYTSGDAAWRPNPVTVTPGKSYKYTGWYQSNVDTELDVEVTMTNGTVEYGFLAPAPASAGWAQLSATYTVPAGASKLTVFQPIAKKGYLVNDDVSLTEYTPAKFDKARVSLTFDDAWRSQFTAGKPVLDKYGMKATFYMLTGVTADPEYMTVDQMKQILAGGHEVASHTIDHPHLPTLSAAEIDRQLKDSQAALRGWMGPSVAKNFCTPFGEYNSTVVSTAKKYYRSHRSTDEGFNTKDATDVYNIKVQNILGTTTPAQVGLWVDQAKRDNSWLVLVYHEVGANSAVEDPTYSVTPANLDAELALIKSKAITVSTVDQALDAVVPQLG